MYKRLDEPSLISKYFKVVCVVALYWITSILTVFVNKTLLNSEIVNLEAPLFVTWFQCLISTIICFSASRISLCFPNLFAFPSGNPLDIDTFRKILPLSVIFTLMVGTNNLCLKYRLPSFYYGKKTSFGSILCCAFIVLGFLLGVDQESLTATFSLRGTVFGVLGSFTLAMYSIHTKKTLVHVNQEIWLLSYYNNFYSSILFLPLIILNGELSAILTYESMFAGWFIAAMIMGGVFGFAIGFLTTLQIQVTSPLTHNISGTAKACAQTVIATKWFNESRSVLWWASNAIVLLASAAYARIKQIEMQRKHERSATTQKA